MKALHSRSEAEASEENFPEVEGASEEALPEADKEGVDPLGSTPESPEEEPEPDSSPEGHSWGTRAAAEEMRYGGGGPKAAAAAARDISDLCRLDVASPGHSRAGHASYASGGQGDQEVGERLARSMRESAAALRREILPVRSLLAQHGKHYTYEDTGAALFGLAGKWEPGSPSAHRHRLKLKYRNTQQDFLPSSASEAVEWLVAGSYRYWDELILVGEAADKGLRCRYMADMLGLESAVAGRYARRDIASAISGMADRYLVAASGEGLESNPALEDGGTDGDSGPRMSLEEAQRAASSAARSTSTAAAGG